MNATLDFDRSIVSPLDDRALLAILSIPSAYLRSVSSRSLGCESPPPELHEDDLWSNTK